MESAEDVHQWQYASVCFSFVFNNLWFHGHKVDLHLPHNILYLQRAWNHFVCELCVESTISWLAIHLMENLSFTQSSAGMWSLKSKFPYIHRLSLFKCSSNNTLDVSLSKDLCQDFFKLLNHSCCKLSELIPCSFIFVVQILADTKNFKCKFKILFQRYLKLQWKVLFCCFWRTVVNVLLSHSIIIVVP